MNRGLREEIGGAINDMPVVDHHEHAWQAFSAQHAQEFDLPYFITRGYVSSDLRAAGYRADPHLFDYLNDPQLPDGAERAWTAIRPFLDRVQSTSYFRYLLPTLREFFGIEEGDLFSDRWREASDRIRRYSQRHKGNGSALCSRLGVTAIVLFSKLDAKEIRDIDFDDERIIQIGWLDRFIHEGRGLAQALEEHPEPTFDRWLAAFDGAFHRYLEVGVKGFKSLLANNRRIEYADPAKDDVARVFHRGVLEASQAEKTAYQDFLMNRLCQLCVDADVPLQIHTGMGGPSGNARPTLLASLFARHPHLRVDLFHGGFPWSTDAGLMAKRFPNVYIDGCWLHDISPSGYRSALTTWVETVPLNKIFAWGGDHNVILEMSYGSLLRAKGLVADVLTDLVEREYLNLELALTVARKILHDNGVEFWRLADRG